jgi:hypothetical protein
MQEGLSAGLGAESPLTNQCLDVRPPVPRPLDDSLGLHLEQVPERHVVQCGDLLDDCVVVIHFGELADGRHAAAKGAHAVRVVVRHLSGIGILLRRGMIVMELL